MYYIPNFVSEEEVTNILEKVKEAHSRIEPHANAAI